MSCDNIVAKKFNHQISSDTVTLGITIDIADIYDGALQVIKRIKPLWIINNIQFKVFTDGCTNKLVGCIHSTTTNNNNLSIDTENVSEIVLVRIYGKNTEILIDRKKEIKNFKLLHSYGFAPQLLATFKNGLAYDYCCGEPLTKSKIYEDNVWQQVAKHMAEMHRDIKCKDERVEPVLWKKFDQMFSLVPEIFSDRVKQQRREELLPSVVQLKEEFERLFDVLDKIESPIVFAHNDLLLGNILFDENEDKVIFIDYEYAGYNFQAYDIGNHFAEFAGMQDIDYTNYPTKEFQLNWLRVYLINYHKNDNVEVTEKDVLQLYAEVNKFALAAHLFWLLWAHNQAEHSDISYDFIEFASIRYNEYLAKRDLFLSL